MDFDHRWSDDPRDRDDYGRELSQGSRGGLSNPREREPLDARDVFTRDLELPRGPEGDGVRSWEDRAAGVAPCLQPPGADGRRCLKASRVRRFRSRKGTASVTLRN
jgi:hypothetical protein